VDKSIELKKLRDYSLVSAHKQTSKKNLPSLYAKKRQKGNVPPLQGCDFKTFAWGLKKVKTLSKSLETNYFVGIA